MAKPFRMTKHHGEQECENCFRWTEFHQDSWICEYCGHDNKPTEGILTRHGNYIASQRAKAAIEAKRKEAANGKFPMDP